MLEVMDTFVIAASVKVEELLQATPQPGNALEPVESIVKDYGAGGLSLVQTIFVYALAISLIVAAVLMVIHGRNRSKTGEIKDGIGWLIGGGILGFSALGLVVFLQNIGASLF